MTPELLAVRRYVSVHAPNVPWGSVLWRLGGKAGAVDADPDRIHAAIADAYWSAIGKGRLRPQ